MWHSTHNRSFRERVFPANHLATVLTKQTYNIQDKHKKPKDTQETPKTNPGLVVSYDIQPGNRSGLFQPQLPEPARGRKKPATVPSLKQWLTMSKKPLTVPSLKQSLGSQMKKCRSLLDIYLCPNPLGELKCSPDPLATIYGATGLLVREGAGGEEKGQPYNWSFWLCYCSPSTQKVIGLPEQEVSLSTRYLLLPLLNVH